MKKNVKKNTLITTAGLLLSSASTGAFAQQVVDNQKPIPNLVSVSTTQNDEEQKIYFEFLGTQPNIRSFKLTNPNRLVLDFLGTQNKTLKTFFDIQGLGAQNVEFAGDDRRLRAVIQLNDGTVAEGQWIKNTYVIRLYKKDVMSQPAVPVPDLLPTQSSNPPVQPSVSQTNLQEKENSSNTLINKETPMNISMPQQLPVLDQPQTVVSNTRLSIPKGEVLAAQQLNTLKPTAAAPVNNIRLSQEILKLDYKKLAGIGEGRLAIDLSNTNTPIDIKTQKNGVIIDFVDTSIPSNLLKRFDVTSEGTPVSSVELRQLSDRARLIIRTQGAWEQTAYQVENKFFFEIKPANSETMGAKTGADGAIIATGSSANTQYKGDKLTLNFQNIEVRTIIQVLSDFSGVNMISSDSVAGNITLRLKDVPWDQALDLILQARNLDKRQTGNVIWIAPQAEIRAKEKADADFVAEAENNKQMITESFQINYTLAANVAALLSNPQQRLLSRRGSAVSDPRTNILFVQDIPERIAAAKSMIKKVDIPVKQVMIEARIVEASDSFGKNLGARLGLIDNRPGGVGAFGQRAKIGGPLAGSTGTRTNIPNNTDPTDPTASPITVGDTQLPTASPITPDSSYLVNLPGAGLNGASPGALSLILFGNSATRFLNLELSALVSDGKGQILSKPRVLTADKQEATIEQGTEIPYSQSTSSGATSVAFRKATLALKVKPQVTPDGNVLMDLSVNKDSVGQNTTAGPSIDTKNIKTQILVEDGGTVVIGGIYTQQDNASETKVPFFGDLPIVGKLFKSRSNSQDRRELLVFITPKIVQGKDIPQDLAPVVESQETIKPIMMDPDFYNATGAAPPIKFKSRSSLN